MASKLKIKLYFVVAAYFGLWASIVLRRWRPRIVAVTGSSGKTTLLHLLQSQLKDTAIYSLEANSSFGVPFSILGLPTNIYNRSSWPFQIIKAPLAALREPPQENIYVVEVDCDRPREGRFLSRLLKPEVTLWVSVSNTHAQKFEAVVGTDKRFRDHLSAIAYEFGWFVQNTSKLVVANIDQPQIVDQLERVPKDTRVEESSIKLLKDYKVQNQHTIYEFGLNTVKLPGLQPKQVAIALQMVESLMNYLGKEINSYDKFIAPPGRSSVFKGVKNTTLIDSTYNTGLGATETILEMFRDYPAETKWIVLGDILESGSLEESEHGRLAKLVVDLEIERLILLGPRVKRHVLPIVRRARPSLLVESYERPAEVLDYLVSNLRGNEAVLFKGARFLEGVVEQLLVDPADAQKLCKRGAHWVKVRQSWGLPK